ncbi:beta strand repeat-containing protein, partial [Algoriphagus yeomjeoni]
MKKIVQLSIFFVLYLSAFQIDAQSFTQFRGLGSDNSAGTGFKTISTNSVLVVSNNATGTTNSVVGSELFSKLTTAGGTDVITLKADGVNSISFDVNDMSIFNFLDPASAADYTTNTKIVFKNSVGTIIRTMTLNATKSLTSSTSGVSIGAFFDNNASLPVTGVSEIEITINPSTVSVDAFTIRNITLNNIVSGAVPSGPATLNFNALGITNTISNTLGKSTAIGPLNFEINSAATNDLITFKSNEGAGGTGALYDNNQDIGGITKWTISRHDGSEFTLSSIYLQEAGVGASTSGTLKARRNGAQVGSTVNVTFNGSIDVSGNPNFSNIDEVWIEAADINFYLDNVAYVIPSTVVTPTLTTSAATSITASGATLNGNVSADGGASVSARGFVYSISDNTPTIGESGVTNVSDGSGTGTFSEAITGLTASTTYYYQAYATNSVGTSYGGVESFGTSAESSSSAIITFDGKGYIDNQDLGNPYTIDSNGETFKFTVSGGVPTSNRYRTTDTWGCNNTGFGDLTAGINTATTWTIEIVSGNEIDLGTIKFNNLFNCYAFTYNLSIEGFKNNSSTGSQSFSVAGMNSIFTPNSSFDDVDKVVITGTDIANLGMDDINWASMATSNTAPTLSTSAASSITATSSTLGGNVTADGGAAVTARGFVYSTSDNTPTIGESGVTNVSDGSGTGVFSEAITGLTASTTYYYQAYATNSVGTSYGGVESFITASSGPIVTDSNISISGASGTGGAFKIGDTVTASWNNTNGGDNNSDVISSVTIDFSQFGGGSAVAATNSSDTWTATYTITAGAIDAFNRNVSVTATNNSSLATTTADTSNARVDNQLPTSTIVVADTQLTAGETSQVTITFSEAVTGFSSADLTVANGSLSG